MSVLILVRHGQASFAAADYDNLSALGRDQSHLLGDFWVRRGLAVDEVFTGPRARQRQTAELVGARHLEADRPWPVLSVLPELDEYDLTGLMHKLAPELVERDAMFASLVEGYRKDPNGPDRHRRFQQMFEALTLHWQTASAAVDGVESWPAFRNRVQRGLQRVLGGAGRGRRVAMFTSGGFIGTAVHLALGAPDRSALEVNWRILNCSLTEFVFSGDHLCLDSFNSVPHLENPALWSYR
jgi:broad specificity phosphatase PhoE